MSTVLRGLLGDGTLLNFFTDNPVFFDFETQSSADLTAVGGRLYAEDPSTRVLSLVALVDGTYHIWVPAGMFLRPPKIVPVDAPDFIKDPIQIHITPDLPTPIREAAEAGRTFVGHNVLGFDRFVWRSCLPGVPEPAWADTLLLSRAAGLPGALEGASRNLIGKEKDSAKRLLMALSRRTEQVEYLDRHIGTLAAVLRYNLVDVWLVARIWEEFAELPFEGDTVELHDKINERGIGVDVELLSKLAGVASESVARAGDQLAALTDGKITANNVRSVKQVQQWLHDHGVFIRDWQGKDTLRKDSVEQALANPWKMLDDGVPVEASRDIDPVVFEVLRVRSTAMRITEGKALRAMQRVSPDSRIRDLFAYHRAGTGRWSSTGVQVHNLPRPRKGLDLERLIELHESGEWGHDARAAWDLIRSTIPDHISVDDAISALIRPALRPADGWVFVRGDFSAVECCGLAWIADEERLLDPLRGGEDTYCDFASRIFGRPITKTNELERQIGKTCLAEGTPILTDRGWIPIENVLPDDRVWDGIEWVFHTGVICNGVKHVCSVDGVYMTPDHKVLTRDGWQEAGCLQGTPLHRPAGRYTNDGKFCIHVESNAAESSPYDVDTMVENSRRKQMCGTIKKVYDITNAGPRNRYQAGRLIVANCILGLGYGMGVEKFRLYCGLSGVDLKAAGVTAEYCVELYRSTYPRIAGNKYSGHIQGRAYRKGGVWGELQDAAFAVVDGRQNRVLAGKCLWFKEGGALVCQLPSGRQIRYNNARIEDRIPGYALTLPDAGSRLKPTLIYDSPRGGEAYLYSGKIAENCVQAICRDLLAWSMLRVERAGVPVVAHVHDEIVLEVPTDWAIGALDVLVEAMTATPEWARGFPLAVEAAVAPRYYKSDLHGWPKKKGRSAV